jgi:tRNA threonylcarbamoyladenosine biosynthesis protein TsaE
MVTTEFITRSPEETIELGRKLAGELRPPKLVLLRGDLGAGKTTITKGIAEAFDAAEQDEVTSPTFTLIHEYRGPEFSVYHIDLYRLDKQRELETLGLEEIIADERNLVLIEWGEKFPGLVPQYQAEIAIERTGPEERKIKFRNTTDHTDHHG